MGGGIFFRSFQFIKRVSFFYFFLFLSFFFSLVFSKWKHDYRELIWWRTGFDSWMSCYRWIIRVFSILICKDLGNMKVISDKSSTNHRVEAKMNKRIDEYSIFELFFKGWKCEWGMTFHLMIFQKSEKKGTMSFEWRFDKCFEMKKKFDKLVDLMRELLFRCRFIKFWTSNSRIR